VNEIASKNVLRAIDSILNESQKISELVAEGRVAVVGAIYDVNSGEIQFLQPTSPGPVSSHLAE